MHQTLKAARGLPKLLPRPPALFQHNAAKTGRLFSSRHPYFRGAPKAMAEGAKRFAESALRVQAEAWAKKHIKGDVVKKGALDVIIGKNGIEKHASTDHPQRYFKDLTLLDLPRLLEEAKKISKTVNKTKKHPDTKMWHYFAVDVNGVPSRMSVKEQFNGQAYYYGISSVDKKSK